MMGSLGPPGVELGFPVGSGGMAVVHYGRREAADGSSEAVAIKELHPHLSNDPVAVQMFFDEARVAARLSHPNVVGTLEVVSADSKIFVVMPYIEGETVGRLWKRLAARGERIPAPIAVAIVIDVLHGLAAVHRATDEHGRPLHIVHRDVSPQNIIVGTDGIARILDFGIAKSVGRGHVTRDGQVKGKLAYMPPEQLGGDTSAATDVYSTAIVLWELLSGRRLFEGSDLEIINQVLQGPNTAPSDVSGCNRELDDVVMKALSREPAARFASAEEMAQSLVLAAQGNLASRAELGRWVEAVDAKSLAERRRRAAAMGTTAPPRWRRDNDDAKLGIGLCPVEDLRPVDGSPQSSAGPVSLAPLAASTAEAIFAPAGRGRFLWPGASVFFALLALGISVASATGFRVREAAASRPIESASPTPTVATTLGAAAPTMVSPTPPMTSPSSRLGARAKVTSIPRASASSASAKVVTDDCDPPFVVDAMGVRQYKRACMR